MGGLMKAKMPKQAAAPGVIEVAKPVMVPQVQPTVRMPVESDTDLLAAAERTRARAMRRKGRLSTILTDRTTQASTGSSGTKLGA